MTNSYLIYNLSFFLYVQPKIANMLLEKLPEFTEDDCKYVIPSSLYMYKVYIVYHPVFTELLSKSQDKVTFTNTCLEP